MSTIRRILVTLVLLSPATLLAGLIDWDGVPETGSTFVPDGYQGFNFTGWDDFAAIGEDFGIANSRIRVANDTPGSVTGTYSTGRNGGFTMQRTDGGLFHLESLFGTNANCDEYDGDIECTAGGFTTQGYVQGNLVFENMFGFSPVSQTPIAAILNYNFIDEFRVWNDAAELMYVDGVAYGTVNPTAPKVAEVPEPMTLSLLMAGFAGLLMAGYRRRQWRGLMALCATDA